MIDETQPAIQSDEWACKKCRARNQPEDRFCGDCGAAHHEPSSDPNPSAQSTITGVLPELKEKPVGALQGAPTVIVASLVGAVVLGSAYHFVARLIDLMILFPIFLGLGVGATIRMAAARGRCRQAALLVAVALGTGATAYAVRQTLDTLQTRNEARRFLAEKNKEPAEFGFLDALRVRAELGIGLTSRRTAKGTLTGAGFWIFLLVETAIVAGVAAASARSFSLLPFCGRCGKIIPAVPVFRVNGRDASRLVHFIRHQKWKEAQQMTDLASATAFDRAEATLVRCGGCNASSIRVDLYEGKRFKRVLHVALPPDSLEALARSA